MIDEALSSNKASSNKTDCDDQMNRAIDYEHKLRSKKRIKDPRVLDRAYIEKEKEKIASKDAEKIKKATDHKEKKKKNKRWKKKSSKRWNYKLIKLYMIKEWNGRGNTNIRGLI